MSNPEKNNSRQFLRWEQLDVARGLAVIAMVFYHLVYDLAWLSNHPLFRFWFEQPIFRFFQVAIGASFIGLSGITFVLTAGNSVRRQLWKRTMILLSFAVVINLVTFWLFPTMPVYFGILHLLAVAPWLSWWWLKIADVKWLLIAAGLVICGGIWLNSLSSGNWLTLAFGWPPARLAMLDYYPLFPWLGVYWLGMVGARVWFRRGESSQSQPVSVSAHFSWLSWAGRNSLLIYILHQPIIVLILTILNRQAS